MKTIILGVLIILIAGWFFVIGAKLIADAIAENNATATVTIKNDPEETAPPVVYGNVLTTYRAPNHPPLIIKRLGDPGTKWTVQNEPIVAKTADGWEITFKP